jgi:Dna[CI] antecedent, DciA
MPKNMGRNKRGKRRMSTTTASRAVRTHSVKELLARAVPGLTRVTDQAMRQKFWRDWLAANLPAETAAKISGVADREGTLVIFAESAAWSARLRFALRELERDIRRADPAVSSVIVRVLPRG